MFTIMQVPQDAPFFVGQYYVTVKNDPFQYLHSDGQIRISVYNTNGEFTGYFPSREAAQTAIDTYGTTCV